MIIMHKNTRLILAHSTIDLGEIILYYNGARINKEGAIPDKGGQPLTVKHGGTLI
jgi:hypothetical protein|nr:MAG TPA: hypothetical protein [Caudoviricetes sp.]